MQECDNFEIISNESVIKIHKFQKELYFFHIIWERSFFNDFNLIKIHFHTLEFYHIAQKKNFNYFKFTFTELYEKLCLLKTF